MLLSSVTAGFTTGAGLIIAIGAQNALVLRQGLLRRHVGLVVALCAMSDIALILCGVGGAGAIVLAWPELLQVLRFGGAAFLAWYALLAARRARHGGGTLAAADGNEESRRRVMLTCLAFTFLNPHVYLDTLVLIGTLSTRYPGGAQWSFGLGACAASVAWFTSLGFGARLVQPLFQKPVAWRVLDGCIALFMAVLCLMLLLNPLHPAA